MKCLVKRMFVFCVVMLMAVSSVRLSAQPKREFRSTWMATVWCLDWPTARGTNATSQNAAKLQMTTYLDQLKGMGLNGICFQVRSMADAMYRSSYEPWSSNISGARGTDPGWDPLAFIVEECHKRGLECYAWVNPYRWSTGTDYNTPQDKAFKDQGLLLTYGTTTIFNPGLPAARQHIVNVCREIVVNYAVDGMVFDDYFYPNGIPSTSAAPDYALYQSSGTSMSIGDWRRANVNALMKDVYDMIQSVRPDVRFGAGPAGIAGPKAVAAHGVESPSSAVTSSGYQYDGIFSDPLAWLEQGTIDFIAPQIYWTTTHSSAPYGPLAQWWSKMAARYGRHHYASQSLEMLASANTQANWAEIARQTEINRECQTGSSSCGSIYYSTKFLNGKGGQTGGYEGCGNYLKENVYTRPSLVPVVTWKNHAEYPAPASASCSESGVLSWNAVDGGNAIVRYTIYAVPDDVDLTEAMDPDGDGIDAAYLVDVSYKTSYTLPAGKRIGYWYAVCVYDGYGYEYAPALVGYTPRVVEDPEEPIEEPGEEPVEEPGEEEQFVFEPGYEILTDGAEYPSFGGINIESMWMRSVRDGFTNISFESNGALNRGMVVSDGIVYISGRSAASASADIYLDRYDGLTGEYLGRIQLSDVGKIGYLPCNDVIKDSKGNVLISNMVLNVSTTPIKIHKVDVSTGSLTEVCSVSTSQTTAKRIDHVAVYGDVDSGNFTVYAAMSSSNQVVRWVFAGGAEKSSSVMTCSTLFPSSKTSFGIAPRIIPVSANDFMLTGGSTAICRYSFGRPAPVDAFEDDDLFSATYTQANGGCVFSLDGIEFLAYAALDHSSPRGVKFNIVASPDELALYDATLVASVPDGGMGKVNSTTCSAPCDYEAYPDMGIVNCYFYSPGNGIAAYRISSEVSALSGGSTTGVEDAIYSAEAAARQAFGVAGRAITATGSTPVVVYTASGMQVCRVAPGNNVALPSAGAYIVSTSDSARKIYVK